MSRPWWLLGLLFVVATVTAASCSDDCLAAAECRTHACGQLTCGCSGRGELLNGNRTNHTCLCDAGWVGDACQYSTQVSSSVCHASQVRATPIPRGLYDASVYISDADDCTCIHGATQHVIQRTSILWPARRCYPPELNPALMSVYGTTQYIFRSNTSVFADAFRFVASVAFDSQAAFAWLFRPSDIHHEASFTLHDAYNPHRTLMANGSLASHAADDTAVIAWEVIGNFTHGFRLFAPGYGYLRVRPEDAYLNVTTRFDAASVFRLEPARPTAFSGETSGLDYPSPGSSLIQTVSDVKHALACQFICMRETACVIVTYRQIEQTCSLLRSTPGSSTTGNAGVTTWTYTGTDNCPHAPNYGTCSVRKRYGPLRIVKQSTRTLAVTAFGASGVWLFDRTQPGARTWNLYPVTPNTREFFIINAATNQALVVNSADPTTTTVETWSLQRTQTWMLQSTCGSTYCSLQENGYMAFCSVHHPSLCLYHAEGGSTGRLAVAYHTPNGTITHTAFLFSVGWEDEDYAFDHPGLSQTHYVFTGTTPTRLRHVHGLDGSLDMGMQTECRSECLARTDCIGYTVCIGESLCYGQGYSVPGVASAAICHLALDTTRSLSVLATTGAGATTQMFSWVRTDNYRIQVHSNWLATGSFVFTSNTVPICYSSGIYIPDAYGSVYSFGTPAKGKRSTYKRNPISVYHNAFDMFGSLNTTGVYDESDCVAPDIGPYMLTFYDSATSQWYALNDAYLRSNISTTRTDDGGSNPVSNTDADYWILRPTRVKDVFSVWSAHNRIYTLTYDSSTGSVQLRNRPHVPTLWKLYTKWTFRNSGAQSGLLRYYYQLELYERPGTFLKADATGVSLVTLSALSATPPTTAGVRDEAAIPYFILHNEYLAATDAQSTGSLGNLAYYGTYQRVVFLSTTHARLQCQTACIKHNDCGAFTLSGANCDLILQATPTLTPWPYGGLTWLRPERTGLRPRKCYLPLNGNDCAANALGMAQLSNAGGSLTNGAVNRWWIVAVQRSEVRFVPVDTVSHDSGHTYRKRAAYVMGSADNTNLVLRAFDVTTFDFDTGRYAFYTPVLNITTPQYRWIANLNRAIQGTSNTYTLATYPSTSGFALSQILNEWGTNAAPAVITGKRLNPSAPESLSITSTVGSVVRSTGSTPGVGVCQTRCLDDPACAAIEYLAGTTSARLGVCRTFAAVQIVDEDPTAVGAYIWYRATQPFDGCNALSSDATFTATINLKHAAAPSYGTLTGGTSRTWKISSFTSSADTNVWRHQYTPTMEVDWALCSYPLDVNTGLNAFDIDGGASCPSPRVQYLMTTLPRGVAGVSAPDSLTRLAFGMYLASGDTSPVQPIMESDDAGWRIQCGGSDWGPLVHPEDVRENECWYGYGISTGP
jgi:hypothetical protein